MSLKKETMTEALMSVGIDIGKKVFHLVGFDPDGSAVVRKKIKRMALEKTYRELPSFSELGALRAIGSAGSIKVRNTRAVVHLAIEHEAILPYHAIAQSA